MHTEDSYTRQEPGEHELALAGPSPKADPARLPLRGDLAHVRLAGQWFVPHYAVPQPHLCLTGARLLAAPREDAQVLDTPGAQVVFEVLDLAGGWAWGQIADPRDEGLVGYVAYVQLAPVA